MEKELIAPCGMNCGLCSGHLRDKKPCAGCSGSVKNKPKGCRECTVTVCEKRQAGKSGFCYECKDYPCLRIKQLDKRYKAKYHMSMMENLAMIKEQGMKAFLKKEEEKWKCPKCGGVISCHNGLCYNCLKQQPKSTWKKIPADKVTAVDLIAPCGMNCGVCGSYLAMKNDLKSQGIKTGVCGGCLPRGKGCTMNKSGGCLKLMTLSVRFCYECEQFPCDANKRCDAVYQEKYNTSLIENLKCIKDYGMVKFLEREAQKWKCPDCGYVICCHNGICYNCKIDELKNLKDKNRWKQ